MRVTKQVRKDAILLSLRDQKRSYEAGDVKELAVTAYTVAGWQSIPQSNAWQLLYELRRSRFIIRHSKPGDHSVIGYSLNKRGQNYVAKNLWECMNAHDEVIHCMAEKYRRSLAR